MPKIRKWVGGYAKDGGRRGTGWCRAGRAGQGRRGQREAAVQALDTTDRYDPMGRVKKEKKKRPSTQPAGRSTQPSGRWPLAWPNFRHRRPTPGAPDA